MHFQDTTRRDAQEVIASLRTVDRHEADVIFGLTTPDAILACVRSTPSFTIFDHRNPVGLFGVRDAGHGVGVPWMIGTDGLTRRWVRLCREARPVFLDQIRPYEVITNQMLPCNTLHRRFVEWLGVTSWEYQLTPSGLRTVRFSSCVPQLLSQHQCS